MKKNGMVDPIYGIEWELFANFWGTFWLIQKMSKPNPNKDFNDNGTLEDWIWKIV